MLRRQRRVVVGACSLGVQLQPELSLPVEREPRTAQRIVPVAGAPVNGQPGVTGNPGPRGRPERESAAAPPRLAGVPPPPRWSGVR